MILFSGRFFCRIEHRWNPDEYLVFAHSRIELCPRPDEARGFCRCRPLGRLRALIFG